ncbi:dihydrolipoamide acetyltransferase family protein [Specibacter sp. NPDC078692]|uniref:dihydrolipoamide acetyltransferase family protein n=1 Tax=Specibacter sp. NPDC078692 TaxID=3155818 RepID=UPI003422C494
MIAEFKLPDLGEGLTESEIVSWQVGVGDTVTLNQVLGEVETAKAVVELPSPYAGVVTAITHEPGTMVEVGEVIIAFEVAGPAGGSSPAKGTEPETEEAPKRVPTLVGYGADPETSARPARRSRAFASNTATSHEAEAPDVRMQADRPRSTPPVRKLARDLGIELELLTGTGEKGLITREDVVSFARDKSQGAGSPVEGPASSAQGQAPSLREVRTPIKGVRKFMAQAMVESAFTAPHVTEFLTVDVTAGMDFLARLRTFKEFDGVKVTPLTLAAKAVTLAIARQPALNSRWDQERGEVVTYNYLNLGIAAATPRGLLVPNIKDVQDLGLRALAVALGDLAKTARDGKTPPTDLAGGTFSITNIGVFGIDAGTPILNPGEAGILALGAVRRVPWEHEGGIALRQVMTLSLSFDHRLVDGAQGSRFLADVGAMMADPAMALVLG